jgi:hypothetical protein
LTFWVVLFFVFCFEGGEMFRQSSGSHFFGIDFQV